MIRSHVVLAGVGASLVAVTAASGQAVAVRAVTDAAGARLQYAIDPSRAPVPYAPRAGEVLWVNANTFFGIPECVGIANNDADGYAGYWLNGDRLQRFDLPGDNIPEWEALNLDDTGSPRGGVSGREASAAGADLAVYTGGPNSFAPPLRISAFRRASSTPIWSHTFANAENGYNLNSSNLHVSRDGSTVAIGLNGTDEESGAPLYQVVLYNGDTGAEQGRWVALNFVGGVMLTDNGAQCLVTVGDAGYLLDRATLSADRIGSVIGSGGHFVISGAGETIAMGGFDLGVWTRNSGGSYDRTVNFSIATSWFGWGLAASRNGDTVGVMTHNYGTSYLDTASFVFNAADGTQLGRYDTHGTGAFQDSIAWAAMSDDGQVFAAASWGTEFNEHPEVLIFDRTCTLIGSIDTFGSPFGVDVSNAGSLVIAGSKGAHANSFGNGGHVTLYHVDRSAPCPCAADFDGSGGTPDFGDITAFFADWLDGVSEADTNCSGGTPDLEDITVFFTEWLAGGC